MNDTNTIEKAVWMSLEHVIDPELHRPITQLDMVSHVSVTPTGHATVQIVLTIAGCPAAERITRNVTEAVAATPGVIDHTITVGVMTPLQRAALVQRLRGEKAPANGSGNTDRVPFGPGTLTRVYAITSGKGGVGKSTITANLAVALAQIGLSVGIIDADVHGFSIPGILGLVKDGVAVKPTRVDNMIIPPIAHGVKVISMGMFLDPANGRGAVAWRGPLLHRTLRQFLSDVFFGDLDILLLDLPPGTGDIALSVGQLLPNAEVLVITTPQAAAADVAERSGIVAHQTGQQIAGVIENMAGLPQADGSVVYLFGSGGGTDVAQRLSALQTQPVPLLASIPLSTNVCVAGDAGVPLVVSHPSDSASQMICAVAARLAKKPQRFAQHTTQLPLRVV